MKKTVLLILGISGFLLSAQKPFQVGSKKITLPGESLYGCFAVEFGDGKPIAYELNFYLEIKGDNLTMYESWEDVKGPAKATIYSCKISKMNLESKSVKLAPSDLKDSTKGSWDLTIPCNNSEMGISYKQYFRSGDPKTGKLNSLIISFGDRQKAVAMYTKMLVAQKKDK